MNGKPTNPKDPIGSNKVPFSTVPAPVIAEVGVAMHEGARKYGRHNWREAGARASVYYDAALRHLTAWWEGQDIDPDSGLPHVTKAMAALAVLRDAQLLEQCEDDRPSGHPQDWQAHYNWLTGLLTKRLPETQPKEE